MKQSIKEQIKFWITFFIGATFAYFTFLTWNKLSDWLGNTTAVWIITGSIVLLAIILGLFSVNKLAKKFTR